MPEVNLPAPAPLPKFMPSSESPTPIERAEVTVDCGDPQGTLTPLWTGVGYDEINLTYTPTGAGLLRTLGAMSDQAYYVRPHYLFCSGPATALPHWGSGNVYHEDDDGNPYYDFTIADKTYDAIVGAGHRPLVELGFTPRALVSEDDFASFPFEDSPTTYSAYESGAWACPPRNLDRWGELVSALARHCLQRYGAEEVSGWLWELWNEPNIFYWRGSEEQFHELYAVTARAVRSVLPEAKVGGPATTGDPSGPPFLRNFLAYCARNDLPLDFVSFHTKGADVTPWRTYQALGTPTPEPQSPSLLKMLREVRASLEVMAEFPSYRDLPGIVDECDASVPAHLGVFDNPSFAYRNTEYYPVFQCALMKKLLDLNEISTAHVDLAMTWSFYFEHERCFEGTRSLLTSGGIEKPLLNAYRMFAKLGGHRLRATSTHAWSVADLDAGQPGLPEEVDTLASTDGQGRYAVLVWRHGDDQYQRAEVPTEIRVRFDHLGPDATRAEVRHWRIDAAYSNSHTAWVELGSPEYPDADQVALIKQRQGLELREPVREVAVTGGLLDLAIHLPLPGVSLLEVVVHA